MHSPKPSDQVDEQLDHMLTTRQVHHLHLSLEILSSISFYTNGDLQLNKANF